MKNSLMPKDNQRVLYPRELGKVLVTGAAGYIGSVLVRRLLDLGYRVRALDLLMYGDAAIRDLYSQPGLEMIVADFSNRDVVAHAVSGIDRVIHLGAIVGDPACARDEDLTIATNFEAARLVATTCKDAGVRRFLFASTCSVYGASDKELDETSALNPVSLYASTKIAAEKVILGLQDAMFAPVILRFATTYGHSYRPRFDLAVNLLTAKAVTDNVITIHGGDQWRPFVHVEDICHALILALEAPTAAVSGEIFNVGSTDQNHQMSEVGEIIRTLIPSARIMTNELVVDKRNYYVHFEKIRRVLDFAPMHTVYSGVNELKLALENDPTLDYRDYRHNNYQHLCQILDKAVRETPPPVAAVRSLGTVDMLVATEQAVARGD